MIEPNSLHITPLFVQLLSQVDEFKGRWKALRWLSPEVLSQLRHVATIESVGSSTRIEGSKMTDKQVETLLATLNKQAFSTRDEQEVAGYASAMNLVLDSYDILPLRLNHLFQLHSILLQDSTKDERHRGGLKTLPNNVAAFDAQGNMLGIVFETTSPFDTEREMIALTDWLLRRELQRDLHPLLVIGIYVVTFLKIHPFQDGNGRMSRILTTLLLLRAGYTYVPYLSLESIVEQNKEGYYRALRGTQRTLNQETPEWGPWMDFFLNMLTRQTVALGSKVQALEQKLDKLSAAERNLLEMVQMRGTLTVAEAVLGTNDPRPTVKKRLAGLVTKGLLVSRGQGRGGFYEKA